MIDTKHLLWYENPASEWLEALPIGNGRLAAMIYGGAPNETFQLNEGTVWAGGPRTYEHPDAASFLPEIRRLIFAGEWRAAQDLIEERFMSRPLRQAPYEAAGFLDLAFDDQSAPTEYRRQLDISQSIAGVEYVSGGIRFTREAFASYPAGLIAIRLAADSPGALSFSMALRNLRDAPCVARGAVLTLDGCGGEHAGTPGAVRYRIEARLALTGGTACADRGRIVVSGATEAVIRLAIGTNYVRYDDVSANPSLRAAEALDKAASLSYAELRDAHIADYRTLYDRFAIDLGSSALADRPTDERVRTHAQGRDPALDALYCRYARYLLISCSREGGLPATLQGLWNDSLTPPWDSKFTININTEMNYWPTGPANLIECYDPLLAHIDNLTVTGEHIAKTHYGASGWVAHHNTDAWAGAAPVDGAFYGTWQVGGAWLCKCIWDRYEFTGDVENLRRHYPAMRGAAQFFLDTLVEDPVHGCLVTCPSNSPENAHHPEVSVCAGPTMDMQIVRDLLCNCAEAARVLDVDAELWPRWTETAARLAPNRVGKAGQLREWLDDWDVEAPEQQHRHTSHLYGLHPSRQIDVDTPELFAAARKTLEMRGDESTGWAMAWRVNLWARLLDGDHAHRLLTSLLSPGRTAPNLFDLHPPFQIDGNFGGASGILEMLIQSRPGRVDLLPALPAAWPSGSLSGVLTRAGIEVALEWQAGALHMAVLTAHRAGRISVRYAGREVALDAQAGTRYELDSNGVVRTA